MLKIDQLISNLILDARNGETGLTNKYRPMFRAVLDELMETKNQLILLELNKLKEHTELLLNKYN